jgi:hypothetical protein
VVVAVVVVVVEEILHKAAAVAFAVDQIVEEHHLPHEELQIVVEAAGRKELAAVSFREFLFSAVGVSEE